MITEQHTELITAYLDGSITPEQRVDLNRLIDQGNIDILDVKEMERLYRQVGKLPVPEPGHELRDRFYTMLDAQKARQSFPVKERLERRLNKLMSYSGFRQLAYGLAIFLTGMLIGNWITPFQNYRQQLSELSTEVSQMREVMMLSLLDNNSATERLKAVNIGSDIRSADERIARALLKTLNNDPNVNVRMAAVEALVRHASDPLVREGLIAAIGKQQSPLVQAALADAMLILQEKRSIKEFRELLERNGLEPGVRDKLQHTIATLN